MRLTKYILVVVIFLSIYGCGKNPMITKLSQIDKGKKYKNECFKSFILIYAANRETFDNVPLYKSPGSVGFNYSSHFQDNEGWIYSPDSKDYNNEYTKIRFFTKTDKTPVSSKITILPEELKRAEAITHINNDKYIFYLKLEISNISSPDNPSVSGDGEYKTKDGIIITINYENTIQGRFEGTIISGKIKTSTDKYLFTLIYNGDRQVQGPITYNGLEIGTIFFKELFRDLGDIRDNRNDGYYTDERGQHWSGVDWDNIGE